MDSINAMNRLLVLGILLVAGLGFSQTTRTITGTVIDGETEEPLPFVKVTAHEENSHQFLAGATTILDGSFSLKVNAPNFYIEISFLGYASDTIRNFNFEENRTALGVIRLISSDQNLDEVTVTAEKSSYEYKLDKKVYNVGSDISSTGMGALEVLNNVPSVNVNIEGEISLRGNSGVQILINGKPSVLAEDGNAALASIPASQIERIEIISNPSAQYQAEGTSGIINIILKKEEQKGLNGSMSLNTGIPDNHSLGVSLNYRAEKFNFFTQLGAGYRSMPRYSRTENRNYLDSSVITGEGINYRNEMFANATLGADYFINDYNTITLSGRYAYEIEQQPSETEISIYESNNELLSRYNRTEVTSAWNPKWQYDLQYHKEFKNKKEHELVFSTLGSFFGKNQNSSFTNNPILGTVSSPNQTTASDFHQRDFTFKLDYTNPITKKITFATGALYEINDVGNDYAVFDEGIPNVNLTNNFLYVQKVLGVYGTGSYEADKWGIKLGLRAENTDLYTQLENTGEENHRNFTNLFPSIHTSYKFSKRFSVQAGYSRRIFRPRLWDLNPFFNIQNIYNIRRGNPDLLPEFGDSYEASGIFIFEKFSFNTGLYYLFTKDVIERVSYFEDGVNITTPINVGTRGKYGVEINGKYTPAKWFSLNADFNYGYFTRAGVFEDQDFSFSSNQWSLKMTTKFKLKSNIDLEFSSNYQSGFKTVQGDVSGFAFVDAGIRKKFLEGKIVANVSVRDIFASRIYESIIQQPDYYLYSFSQRGRFITLGVSYSFGDGEAVSYSGGRR